MSNAGFYQGSAVHQANFKFISIISSWSCVWLSGSLHRRSPTPKSITSVQDGLSMCPFASKNLRKSVESSADDRTPPQNRLPSRHHGKYGLLMLFVFKNLHNYSQLNTKNEPVMCVLSHDTWHVPRNSPDALTNLFVELVDCCHSTSR